ncbi:type IV pilus modification PilV family protein [Adhaeretor mobilis]|uniref:Prepilin-type N-terminal cleavage/methylation domain-containing protein n=1 Tax=Adhaeretor mobilis TaxID=1930276 RepID=A0A517N0X1_9BACT|nr:prepilin-type N-terminal cleavage/methylation domain-containing protein [Adhaeretor mobilis]QDT00792.1 hypothetical protein HG15A2_41340 [Adhaeretor mobilis]
MNRFNTKRKGRTSAQGKAPDRAGFTLTELLVAATLLVVALSVVGSLTVRTGRLWQDSRHYRLALDELSNQLDRLTTLDQANLATAIQEIKPSEQIEAALPNPKLSVELLSDEYGTRLLMQLAWDRLGKSSPVSLVGWVDPLPKTASEAEPNTEVKTDEGTP